MDNYFTGDLHLGHTNVIKYAKRPYKDSAEMDEALITNWNARVRPEDSIYLLGDLAFCPVPRAEELLKRLHGVKYWIFGNHDKRLRKEPSILAHFKWATDFREIKIADPDAVRGLQDITLCHYAMRVWNKSHYGAWNLYGHSHNSLPDNPNALQLDVGVDARNYAPVSYQEIKALMRLKTFKPIDHHGTKRE